jgi:hyperosmotically inducible periplasmic protein
MKSGRIVWVAAALVAVLSAACGQTDAGITTAVKSKFAADNDVKAYQIDVDTNNKVVTLSGTVETATAKARAVEIARATDGVANVVDNVTVNAATATAATPDAARVMSSDPALTAAIKGKFMADTTVAALKIDVDTSDGVVTLTGQVRSQTEKDQALKIARETDGVKSVVDRLTVTP